MEQKATLEEEFELLEIPEVLLDMVERYQNNDEALLSSLFKYEEESELLEAHLSVLEYALMEKHKVLTESVFKSEHDKALTVYHTLCEREGFIPRL